MQYTLHYTASILHFGLGSLLVPAGSRCKSSGMDFNFFGLEDTYGGMLAEWSLTIFDLVTPFSKRNATLICPFFLVPLGHWPWHRVFMSIAKMVYNSSFTGIHSSPKERHLQKCCVSFGKECSYYGRLWRGPAWVMSDPQICSCMTTPPLLITSQGLHKKTGQFSLATSLSSLTTEDCKSN